MCEMLVNCIRITKSKQIITTEIETATAAKCWWPEVCWIKIPNIVGYIGNRAAKLNQWFFFSLSMKMLCKHIIANPTRKTLSVCKQQ